MECAVKQSEFNVKTWVASEWPFFQTDLEAFFNRWPEFPWYVTPGDLRFEDVAFAGAGRLDNVVNFRELARTTGLLFVRV